jgi:hypothetical protein
MKQTIRPLGDRLSSGMYSQLELQMIVNQVSQIEWQVEPKWRLLLNNLSIKEADVLVNGAPN